MENYKWNRRGLLSNIQPEEVISDVRGESFTHCSISPVISHYQNLFGDRITRLVSKLRESESEAIFVDGNIDEAINSLSRFVSLMGDAIEKYKEDIQFDTDLSDSIEITFSGQEIMRFNLMFTEMNTYEEAFLFYVQDGRPTQINGSLPIMVEKLKQLLR